MTKNNYINHNGTVIETLWTGNIEHFGGSTWYKVDGNVGRQLTSSFAPAGSNIHTRTAQEMWDNSLALVAASVGHKGGGHESSK